MDEQAIRQWAWNELRGYTRTTSNPDGTTTEKSLTRVERMQSADELAAWVMSGKLPPLPVPPATFPTQPIASVLAGPVDDE